MDLQIGQVSKKYALLCFLLLISSGINGQRLTESDPQLRGIDIEEHLGSLLPLDLVFVDENGQKVLLEEFFDNSTPVVFNLVYYECPMLCTFVLNGLMSGLSELKWQAGTDYRLVTLSINPEETYDLAKGKQKSYLPGLSQVSDSSAWKFLVGSQENITAVADTLGFRYYYDEELQEYAHTAATFILTGDGKISRYLYGLQYKPLDLRLALLEASEGKIGTTVDRLILYCYGYDPTRGGYVVIATQIMKIGGLLTLIILAVFIGFLWKRDKHITAKLNKN